MGVNEGVLHADPLVKNATAFLKMSRSSVTRASSRWSRATSSASTGQGRKGVRLVSRHLVPPLIELVAPDAQIPGRFRRRFARLLQQADGFGLEGLAKRLSCSHWTPPGAIVPFLSVHENRGSST